jgi:hypothetical protein
MRRIHFFEIEDQSWCPPVIRAGITDYLQFVINAAKPYAPVAQRLAAAIRSSRTSDVVDLCSGAGGPWLTLVDAVETSNGRPRVTLTDRWPNVAAFERLCEVTNGAIRYNESPVDARHVPPELRGTRTLFSSLHHFRPDDARAVLRDAAKSGATIAVFEATHRSVATILVTLLAPIAVLLVTPAIRPFRWSRLFWTYLVPVIPLVTLFDGIVSCLRTYTPAELMELTQGIDGYAWNAGEERVKGPVPVTYLIGAPDAGSDAGSDAGAG